MIAFIYLCLFFSLLFPGKSLSAAELLSKPLQQNCIKIFGGDSSGANIRQALLCGKKITDPQSAQALSNWGILHLAVVSGSHLIFLQSLLLRLKAPNLILWAVLGCFVFLSGFQPPVVRSLIALVVRKLSTHNQHLWSTAICLAIFPEWSLAGSFWLSCLAALLCEWPLADKIHKSSPWVQSFYRQFFIFILMSPVCYFLSPQSPLAIFSNFIFSYLLGPLWIPMALLPWSENWFTFLIRQALHFEPFLPLSRGLPYKYLLLFLIPYFFILSAYFYQKERQKKQCYLYS